MTRSSTTSRRPSATRRWCGSTASPRALQATVLAKLEFFNPLSQREGPHRRGDDRGCREARGLINKDIGDHRADQRQHRHRAGLRLRGARLQADPDDAGDHEHRAPPAARGARRRTRADAGRRGDERRDRARPRRSPPPTRSAVHAAAVQEPGQPGDPRARPPAPEIWNDTDGDDRHSRVRRRHGRHDHRRLALHQEHAEADRLSRRRAEGEPGHLPDAGRRAAQARPAQDPGHRRGLHPGDAGPLGRGPRRAGRQRGGDRIRPASGARGGAARRHLVRRGRGGRRAAGAGSPSSPERRSS